MDSQSNNVGYRQASVSPQSVLQVFPFDILFKKTQQVLAGNCNSPQISRTDPNKKSRRTLLHCSDFTLGARGYIVQWGHGGRIIVSSTIERTRVRSQKFDRVLVAIDYARKNDLLTTATNRAKPRHVRHGLRNFVDC